LLNPIHWAVWTDGANEWEIDRMANDSRLVECSWMSRDQGFVERIPNHWDEALVQPYIAFRHQTVFSALRKWVLSPRDR
jgi:hypothetical protein